MEDLIQPRATADLQVLETTPLQDGFDQFVYKIRQVG
jgi:hypothetical protein